MIDKELVKHNFSKYARYYDRYSTIQNLSASKLISKVEGDFFDRILDIGCGTGNYTKLLREKFPKARIKAIDISSEMIEVAKEKLHGQDIEFIIDDAETIDPQGQFDLISSNASFQWFENLECALSRYAAFLKKGGVILFSIFGPATFHELDKALKELSGKKTSINSCNFCDKPEMEKILKRILKNTDVERKIYRQNYNSLTELLKNIKYTGTRGNGADAKNLWTPKMIRNLEKIYMRRSKRITATYQIFFCKGVK